MILRSLQETGPSLILIEGALTAIALAMSFALPTAGSRFFSLVERMFGQLARRKVLSVIVVGLAAFLLRLAILPWSPTPQPFVHDDFSFLLAADTFASGRLANPTPTMWVHFETFHETMRPTYMSMYFPAQGLVMAAGKVLAGRAWYGILAMTATMCAAICWMLQAWLPPGWALLGGLLAVVRLGLFSYWINTYSGGGSIAALGGALVLGALPRLMKTIRLREGTLMAVGMVLLAASRPYEGIILCVPVVVVLGRRLLFGNNRPTAIMLLRCAGAPLLLIAVAGAWMGYYNYRAFGSPLTPPYAVDRAAYAVVPYFVWQAPRREPIYRNDAMRRFYLVDELGYFQKVHAPRSYLSMTLLKALRGILFYAGIALLPPLIMLRRVFLDRRIRFLVLCVLLLLAGVAIETFLIPHYLAPFTAAFYAIGLQAMRHLRVWKPGGQPVGITMVRFVVTLCVALAGLRLYAQPLKLELAKWPSGEWAAEWYGSGPDGDARAKVAAMLNRLPGGQLAIVRYSPAHDPLDEWVYNRADIDRSKVVWAREMDAAENRELIQYYKDRRVWLVQPDMHPAQVTAYPLAEKQDTDTTEKRRNVSSLTVRIEQGRSGP